MNPFADLAEEVQKAHDDHLNSFGGSPKDVAQKRAALERVLRDDTGTIIQALRIAARSQS